MRAMLLLQGSLAPCLTLMLSDSPNARPAQAAMSGAGAAQQRTCAVCFDTKTQHNIICCRGCGVTVHRACYRARPSDPSDWQCAKCEAGAKDVSCLICASKFGAFKRLTDTDWCHSDCMLWLADSRVDKVQHKGATCSLCKTSLGICVECSNDGCDYLFHPVCARVAKLLIMANPQPKSHSKGSRVAVGAFCPSHAQSHTQSKTADSDDDDSPAMSKAQSKAAFATKLAGLQQLLHSTPGAGAGAGAGSGSGAGSSSASSGGAKGAAPMDLSSDDAASDSAGSAAAPRSAAPSPPATRAGTDVCCVCFSSDCEDQNPVVRCGKCSVAVHCACYGVDKPPAPGVRWLCRKCEKGNINVTCVLCPHKSGAFKPTTDGRWAHVLCGVWIPETSFVDPVRMEPLGNVHKIHPQRWKLLCSVCNKRYGACLQCCAGDCTTAFHPLCAQSAGMRMEVQEARSRPPPPQEPGA